MATNQKNVNYLLSYSMADCELVEALLKKLNDKCNLKLGIDGCSRDNELDDSTQATSRLLNINVKLVCFVSEHYLLYLVYMSANKSLMQMLKSKSNKLLLICQKININADSPYAHAYECLAENASTFNLYDFTTNKSGEHEAAADRTGLLSEQLDGELLTRLASLLTTRQDFYYEEECIYADCDSSMQLPMLSSSLSSKPSLQIESEKLEHLSLVDSNKEDPNELYSNYFVKVKKLSRNKSLEHEDLNDSSSDHKWIVPVRKSNSMLQRQSSYKTQCSESKIYSSISECESSKQSLHSYSSSTSPQSPTSPSDTLSHYLEECLQQINQLNEENQNKLLEQQQKEDENESLYVNYKKPVSSSKRDKYWATRVNMIIYTNKLKKACELKRIQNEQTSSI
jgi:hypothetical protein